MANPNVSQFEGFTVNQEEDLTRAKAWAPISRNWAIAELPVDDGTNEIDDSSRTYAMRAKGAYEEAKYIVDEIEDLIGSGGLRPESAYVKDVVDATESLNKPIDYDSTWQEVVYWLSLIYALSYRIRQSSVMIPINYQIPQSPLYTLGGTSSGSVIDTGLPLYTISDTKNITYAINQSPSYSVTGSDSVAIIPSP